MLDSQTDKHWHIGYVSGSFDMFHMGHLNLLRRAKERCDYLIVGVLSDQCIFNHKKRIPVIPLGDRIEIVSSCKYVDEVDITTKELLNKIAAWKKYHFDAMFTGDDHKNDGWAWEEPELNALGAELVFFPYTKTVSSTMLRGILKGEERRQMKKVITYGTFDLFHDGHKELLERAKILGDYLVVGITAESYNIQRSKLNVVDSLIKRIDNVRNSGIADEIIVEEDECQKTSDIKNFGIDVFAVSSDWKGKYDYLKEYCEIIYLEKARHLLNSKICLSKNGVVRLGIVGSGRIAKRTLEEIKFVSGVNVVSVYNPRKMSADKFAQIAGLDSYSGNYMDFLKGIDAVYIASPHDTHYGYTKEALLEGKHVLCEKPFVLKKSEAEELFEMAAFQNLVLMEAIKTAYAPGFLELLESVRNGKIGKVYDIEATFTKLIKPGSNIREYNKKSGGSFTELASYPLLPIIKLLGWDYRQLFFEMFNCENNVDIYAKAHFQYKDAIATVKTGIGVKSEGQLLISGTSGYILVKSPWWLIKNFEICYENPNGNESFSAIFPGYGMRFEVADFIQNINKPNARNYKLLQNESIAMAGVIEQFLKEKEEHHSFPHGFFHV